VKNIAIVIISSAISLSVLMCSSGSSTKEKVMEFDADPGGVADNCETVCAICASERDEAINTAKAWKELAEQCVHDKVKVKSR